MKSLLRSTEIDEWFYFPTNENPVDVITRLERFDLTKNIWWYGPAFIQTKDLSDESTAFNCEELPEERTNDFCNHLDF